VSKLQLSAALSENPINDHIASGAARAQGIECTVSRVHPSEMYWRQLRFGDFDVSEMSLASLAISAARGRREWTAIPVFTVRRFFHTGIVVRRDSGIERPADLKGRRISVPEYQQTSAVWCRGALEHEFGVTPADVSWFMERPPARSHGGATEFEVPEGVSLTYVPEDTSAEKMLVGGELDGAMVYIADRNLVDRSRRSSDAIAEVRTLFPDPVGEGVRYLRTTGILPANHVLVVRTEVLEAAPWVALNLYSAFLDAKERALGEAEALFGLWRQIGALPAGVGPAAADPLPFGFAGQEPMLRTLGGYLAEQGLTPGEVDMASLFAPSTLDL
jgi:4,5-dihydroxyphthalate decarboxylase